MNSHILPVLSYHTIPITAIIGYVSYPKKLRIDPEILYLLSVIHNGALIAFSSWTFLSITHILYNKGIVFKSNYYFQNPEFDNVIFWFYLSKYYEFFDTFLLYLNGKSPIFLQKYHHIGAVLSWHLMYIYKVDMVWMASLFNSFVHTIMYSYYLGCLLKINQVRFIKQYITSLQLCQFFLLYINFYCYRPPIETWFNYYIIIFFATYGIGIIGLFGKFYYNSYILKNDVKNKLK
jgi:hypothetical protein